jgi:hypothetical protein
MKTRSKEDNIFWIILVALLVIGIFVSFSPACANDKFIGLSGFLKSDSSVVIDSGKVGVWTFQPSLSLNLFSINRHGDVEPLNVISTGVSLRRVIKTGTSLELSAAFAKIRQGEGYGPQIMFGADGTLIGYLYDVMGKHGYVLTSYSIPMNKIPLIGKIFK